jgi:hypothetical protein
MRLTRSIVVVASAASAVAGSAVVAPAAEAQPAPIHIAGTDGQGVLIFPEPDNNAPAVGWMPEGASPDYVCWTQSQLIGAVDVWFQINYNGVSGWYPSQYDDSSYPTDDAITGRYGIPNCGSASPAGDAVGGGSAPVATSGAVTDGNDYYNGAASAQWALDNAQSPQSFPAACAWFASQALWAGGLPKTDQWTDQGGHGFLWSARPGTAEATAVGPLIDYLRSTFPAATWEQVDFAGNAVPDAAPGDLIAYDWDGDGVLDHVAVVTDIASGQYPDVAEWGTVDFVVGHPTSTYSTRGWTWSQSHNEWLQQEFPNVQAYLLHINSSTPVSY